MVCLSGVCWAYRSCLIRVCMHVWASVCLMLSSAHYVCQRVKKKKRSSASVHVWRSAIWFLKRLSLIFCTVSHLHPRESEANMPYGTVGPDWISSMHRTTITHISGRESSQPNRKTNSTDYTSPHSLLARRYAMFMGAIRSAHQQHDGRRLCKCN